MLELHQSAAALSRLLRNMKSGSNLGKTGCCAIHGIGWGPVFLLAHLKITTCTAASQRRLKSCGRVVHYVRPSIILLLARFRARVRVMRHIVICYTLLVFIFPRDFLV